MIIVIFIEKERTGYKNGMEKNKMEAEKQK
jgi:hypothetical protein